jgi:hypothetical protein
MNALDLIKYARRVWDEASTGERLAACRIGLTILRNLEVTLVREIHDRDADKVRSP